MADYTRSTTIQASADGAFAYLADARNMPRYIDLMTSAHTTGDGLRVAADVGGRHEEGEATFSADASARRIDWGRDDSDYRGWLEVDSGGEGRSTVTIHLHTKGDADDPRVVKSLDATLDNIRAVATEM